MGIVVPVSTQTKNTTYFLYPFPNSQNKKPNPLLLLKPCEQHIKSSILRREGRKKKTVKEMKQFSSLASFLSTLLVLQLIPTAISLAKHVPADTSKLKTWLADNINEFNERKPTISYGIPSVVLDKLLATAEDNVKVITVAKDVSADYPTITDAVNSIPLENKRRTIIWIGGGEYWEKITINISKPFITFYGDPADMPKIVFNGTAAIYGTVYSATVAVESDYFMAVNVAFVVRFPSFKVSFLVYKRCLVLGYNFIYGVIVRCFIEFGSNA